MPRLKRNQQRRGTAGARDRHAFVFLGLLIVGDVVFLVLHLLYSYSPYVKHGLFSLEKDGGYAERYQYVKEFAALLLLAVLWGKTRRMVYAAWSLLFAYLLSDDAFQLHERLGEALSPHLWPGVPPFLRSQDLGELAVWATAGVVLLTLIGITHARGSPDARRISRNLALIVGVAAVFGVFFDMLHVAVGDLPGNSLFIIVEDWGEMLSVSVLCWYVLRSLKAASSGDEVVGGVGGGGAAESQKGHTA